MKKWEKFSIEEIQQITKECYSYAQLGERLGYNHKSGSGSKAIKDMIEELNLDTSHFKGQGWNKDNFDYSRFKYGNNIKNGEAVKAITCLRGWKCEQCGNETWFNEKIPLEIHHKDGNNQNNEMDNLILLCPNCHALTENWCDRNINKIRDYITDNDFVEALKSAPNIRQALLQLGLSAKGANYIRANELIVKYQISHLLKT